MYATAVAGDGGIRLRAETVGTKQAGGSRGKIKGFSKASRRRLIDSLMMFPWADYAQQDPHANLVALALVTLTYPREYPESMKTVKRHLDNLHRAFGNDGIPVKCAMWRLEFQKRGAPHYHLLLELTHPVGVTGLQNWLRRTWYRICGSGDPLHLTHGVDLRVVHVNPRSPSKLMLYLIKYLGKLDETTGYPGRIWGVWGEWSETYRAAATFRTREGYVEFLRRVRKWGRRSNYLRDVHGVSGLRLYCSGTSVLLCLCRGLDGVDVYLS